MENSPQIVAVSFFKFNSFKSKFWAFKTIGKMRSELQNFAPSKFTKILGSGGKSGFSIWPNWGLYCILAIFDNDIEANNFLENNEKYLAFKSKSVENKLFILSPNSSHGLWDGVNPFVGHKQENNNRIAVITRGKIKVSKLWQFWKFVPPASQNLENQDGLLFSIGIGELPIIQQATFSVWESAEKMKAYAYKSTQHTQVIQKTRELGWYSEELFARFSVLKE